MVDLQVSQLGFLLAPDSRQRENGMYFIKL